jgi:hypothetical protein
MHQGIDLLHEALQSDLPEDLTTRVRTALSRERARQARMAHTVRMLSGGISLISFGGLFVSIQAFVSAASASGFTAYASLIVSDSSIVSAHFTSFFASLVESLPSIESTLVLALVAVFLVSLRSSVGFGIRPRIRIA